MVGGLVFLDVVTQLVVEITLLFRVHPIMLLGHISITALAKEPTRMKVCLTTMFPNGKNGII